MEEILQEQIHMLLSQTQHKHRTAEPRLKILHGNQRMAMLVLDLINTKIRIKLQVVGTALTQ